MLTTDLTDSMGVFQGVHPFNPFNPLLNIPSSRNPFNPFNPLLILPKQSCCCGGRIPPLLSSAPNESVLICEICGRLSSAAGSVDSVQSVGGLLLARLVHLRQVHPLKMHLCNLWEVLLSSRFCVNLLSMLKSKCFDHYFHFKL